MNPNRCNFTRAAVNVAHQIFHIGLGTPAATADIFVWYHPHIQTLEAQIHPRGWVSNVSPFRRLQAALTDLPRLEQVRTQLIADVKTLTEGGTLERLPKESPFKFEEDYLDACQPRSTDEL